MIYTKTKKSVIDLAVLFIIAGTLFLVPYAFEGGQLIASYIDEGGLSYDVITNPTLLLNPLISEINNIYDDLKDTVLFVFYNVLAPIFIVILFLLWVLLQMILIQVMRFIIYIEIQVIKSGAKLIMELFSNAFKGVDNSYGRLILTKLLFFLEYFQNLLSMPSRVIEKTVDVALEDKLKDIERISKIKDIATNPYKK